jgi:hypothetical protein
MAWKLRGAPKTVRITNKLAKEWSEMPSAHVDRPLRERRLGVYRTMLEGGLFRPVSWAKAYCKEIDEWERVNGKHTSTLFAMVDLTKFQDLYAVIEEYDCDSIEDVARLYSTFDSATQARNSTDVNRSFAATVPELRAMDEKAINLFVSAIAYSKNPSISSGSHTNTAMDRAEDMLDHVPFCVWAHEIMYGQGLTKQAAHLRRQPVVAAMFATYNKAKGAATEFWTAVRDETGTTPDVPDRKLARFLLQMKLAATGQSNGIPKRFRLTPKEFYVKSILAWNAWRKKTITHLKYFADAELPTVS